MLKPTKMTRVVIVGTKDLMEPVISTFHNLKLLHITDFLEENETFRIGKRLKPFDRINLFNQFRQDSHLVAAARPDLQDLLLALKLQAFGHERDHIRLRYRLVLAYRQRIIVIGARRELLRYELVPRHFPESALSMGKVYRAFLLLKKGHI